MANVLMIFAGDRGEEGTIRRRPPLSKSFCPGGRNRGVDATVGKLDFERVARLETGGRAEDVASGIAGDAVAAREDGVRVQLLQTGCKGVEPLSLRAEQGSGRPFQTLPDAVEFRPGGVGRGFARVQAQFEPRQAMGEFSLLGVHGLPEPLFEMARVFARAL